MLYIYIFFIPAISAKVFSYFLKLDSDHPSICSEKNGYYARGCWVVGGSTLCVILASCSYTKMQANTIHIHIAICVTSCFPNIWNTTNAYPWTLQWYLLLRIHKHPLTYSMHHHVMGVSYNGGCPKPWVSILKGSKFRWFCALRLWTLWIQESAAPAVRWTRHRPSRPRSRGTWCDSAPPGRPSRGSRWTSLGRLEEGWKPWKPGSSNLFNMMKVKEREKGYVTWPWNIGV